MNRFKKFFVGSVVSLLLCLLVVPPVSAQTSAELQARINALMAQIEALNVNSPSIGVIAVEGLGTQENSEGENGEVGDFTIEFEVTALDEDVYIKGIATQSINGDGVTFTVEGPGGAEIIAALSSPADEEDGYFVVEEGETESFEANVWIKATVAGKYRVALKSLFHSQEPKGKSQVYTLTPKADFQTKYVALTGLATSPKTITVTAPNGGEKWGIGTTNTVTWTPYGYDPDINPAKYVTAYLETKNANGSFKTLGKVQDSGKASIHWPTGELNSHTGGGDYAPAGSGYYIRVVNHKTGATDRSNQPFTLVAKPIDLKVNGSDGPVKVALNEKVTLSWSTKSVTKCEIHNAYKDTSRKTQIGVVPLNGQMEAYLHTDLQWGPTLYCYTKTGDSIYDSVKRTAPSTTPTPTATLKVFSPNGGEKIDPTKELSVDWDAQDVSTISVALYKNDMWKAWIVKDMNIQTANESGVKFTPNKIMQGLGQGDNAGNIFKIYITGQKADGSGYVEDKSDTAFQFVLTEPVVTPNLPATKEAFVKHLYSCVLSRTPDSAGLTNWLTKTGTTESFYQGFFNSPEFTKKNLNNEAFVDTLYKCTLYRSADAGGKANWVKQLEAGTSRKDILNWFMSSTEFTTKIKPTIDRVMSDYVINHANSIQEKSTVPVTPEKSTPRFGVVKGAMTPTITVPAVFGRPVTPVAVTGPAKVGTVSWGDGTTETVNALLAGTEMTVALKHTYKKSGKYTITLTDLANKKATLAVQATVPTTTPTVLGASTTNQLAELQITLQVIHDILETLK